MKLKLVQVLMQVLTWAIALIIATTPLAVQAQTNSPQCVPTPPDMLGPFYKPQAPVRSQVGSGYVLSGKVLSAGSCTPLVDAVIELWLAGPNGKYGDSYRATMFSGEDGSYRFESNYPGNYGRPPHIHLRVHYPGYEELITQHYPQAGATAGEFALVLQPSEMMR